MSCERDEAGGEERDLGQIAGMLSSVGCGDIRKAGCSSTHPTLMM